MTRIAVVGAHGKVGQLVLRLAVERADEAIGVIRNPDHIPELEQLGAEAQIVDIESATAEELAQAFVGADAVVFSAGAGGDSGPTRKRTVDYGGSVLTAEAARIAGVKRVVQVSAIGVDEPLGDDVEEGWAAYVQAKREADEQLRATDLDWTIIRPGGLLDEPATGSVQLAERTERGSISRADVAAVVLAAIDDERTIGKQWELIAGERTIAEAIDAALAG